MRISGNYPHLKSVIFELWEKPQKTNFSVQDYLDLQNSSEEKYEYLNGKVFATAGGTVNHNRIARNLSRLIENARYAGKHDCEAFINDVRLKIANEASYVYPDVFSVCGEPKYDEADPLSITNAVLVVEVLSESTIAYDR